MVKSNNKNILNLRKKDYIFFLLLFIVCLIYSFNRNHYKVGHWKSEIRADKAGYYVYLPALFLYNFDSSKFPENAEKITGNGFFLDKNNHKVSTKYTYGVAALHTPFFLIAHAITKIKGDKADGFSQLYFDFTNISAVFYLVLGLFFLFKFLLFYFERIRSYLVVTFILLGTNLLYYSIIDGLMSHVYFFFLFSLLLYTFKKLLYYGTDNRKLFLIIAIILGGIIVVRPMNIIYAGLSLLLLDISNIKDLIVRIRMFTGRKNIILLTVFIILILAPQLIYWKYLTGNLFYYSYEGEGFLHWSRPKLFEIFFSTNNGLLLYTPLYIIFFAGIVFMFAKNIKNALLILICLIVISYISASWWSWYFGCAYSHRNFIDLLPLFALAFGHLLYFSKKKSGYFKIILLILPIAYFSYFNLKLTHNYGRCSPLDPWAWKEYNNLLMKSGLNYFERKCFHISDNFENTTDNKHIMNSSSIIKTKRAYSGKNISKIDSSYLHGIGYKYELSKICPYGLKKVKVRFKGLFPKNTKDIQLVFNINDQSGKAKVWYTVNLAEYSFITDKWITIKETYCTTEEYEEGDNIMVYLLNPSKEIIFIDDLDIWFYENSFLGKSVYSR